MTSPRSNMSSTIDFDDQDAESSSELQFQDFGHDTTATLKPSETFTSNLEEETGLLSEEKKPPSFWEFSYYQDFFDVDTDQVLQRLIWSMIPLPGRATFLDRQIRPKPDLYGPFWIATTLTFTTAISANIADFFVTKGENNKIWHYDFSKVSLAGTAIFSYAFLVPLALFGLMWYRQSSTRYTLFEMLSVYGYSLFIYVPISILWVIQVPALQWILVIIGATLSGTVLVQTFWPIVQDEHKKIAFVVLGLIMLFHTLLAVGFVAYFFQHSYTEPASTSHIINIVTPNSVTTTLKGLKISDREAPMIENIVNSTKAILKETVLKPLSNATL